MFAGEGYSWLPQRKSAVGLWVVCQFVLRRCSVLGEGGGIGWLPRNMCEPGRVVSEAEAEEEGRLFGSLRHSRLVDLLQGGSSMLLPVFLCIH